MKKILVLFVAAVMAASCNSTKKDGLPQVVCTTNIVADAVRNILPDSVAQIKSLMGPGVDPHLYKATQGDIEKLSKARVIVYNGLHLEGKMGEIFKKLKRQKSVIAMGEQVAEEKLINSTDYQGASDPHIWFDIELWAEAITGLSQQLQKEFPEDQSIIKKATEVYLSELAELDDWVSREVQQIPDSQRVMITAHDAFKYFGKAYNIQVRGLQGISTTAEYGLRDISDLVSYLTQNEIKAIFVESSVPKRSIEAVIEGARSEGHSLQLGGELYSDAMGAEGTPEGTYTGMVKHNVKTIVEALN